MRWQPTRSEAPASGPRSLSLFVVATVLFGTGFVGIELGLAALPPVLFAALRFDVAAAVLVPLTLARRKRAAWKPTGPGDWAAVAVATVFMFALNGGLLFVGQNGTTAGAAAVTYGLLPVLAPVFAAVLLPEERLGAVGALGVLVGLAGVVVVVSPSPAALTGGVGQFLVAGAAASVALGSVLLRRANPDLGSLPVTAWGMVGGAALLHAASFALGETPGAIPTETVIIVVYVGLFATGAAFPAYFALIRRAGAVRANLISYAVPVVTTLAAWLVLGENPAPTTAGGFLLIAAGFALVEREPLRSALREIHTNMHS